MRRQAVKASSCQHVESGSEGIDFDKNFRQSWNFEIPKKERQLIKCVHNAQARPWKEPGSVNVLVTRHAAHVAPIRLQLPGLLSFSVSKCFPTGLTETHTFRVYLDLGLGLDSGPGNRGGVPLPLGLRNGIK